MDMSGYNYVKAVFATFGLPVASYQFVQDPIRRSNFLDPRAAQVEAMRIRKN